jgi:hypothetical protein
MNNSYSRFTREVCVQPAVQLSEWLWYRAIYTDQRPHPPQLSGVEPIGLAEIAESDLTPRHAVQLGEGVHQRFANAPA